MLAEPWRTFYQQPPLLFFPPIHPPATQREPTWQTCLTESMMTVVSLMKAEARKVPQYSFCTHLLWTVVLCFKMQPPAQLTSSHRSQSLLCLTVRPKQLAACFRKGGWGNQGHGVGATCCSSDSRTRAFRHNRDRPPRRDTYRGRHIDPEQMQESTDIWFQLTILYGICWCHLHGKGARAKEIKSSVQH